MQPAFEPHAPEVRCYRCGSPRVSSLCHHCGRPMCAEHRPQAHRAKRGPRIGWLRPARADVRASKPVSRELAGLGLDGGQVTVYHCEDDAHVVKSELLAWRNGGTAAAVLGLALLAFVLVPGVVLALAGAGTAVCAVVIGRRRAEDARRARPPLPLVPALDAVTVVERLHGRVSVTHDGYQPAPPLVEGEIGVDMTLGRGSQDRLARYRDKFRLSHGDRAEFCAGFAVIRGEAGLTFRPGQEHTDALLRDGATFMFHGDAAGHPLFGAVPGRPAGEWNVRLGYDLLPARRPAEIPLWVVPSLIPASGRRTLEIDLLWNLLGPQEKRFGLERFDLIELNIPAEWGNVERVWPDDATITSPQSGQARCIRWQRLEPTEENGKGSPAGGPGQSRTLRIRFEHQITEQPRLEGRVEATFKGTLSGLTGITFYLPGGGKRPRQPEVKPRTEVSVDLEISLDAIRYQDNRVVPVRGHPDDLSRDERDEFPEVIPDYRTVIQLTNALSGDGYYVKRVIEHQPHRREGRVHVVSRLWDVAGRWYEGVFPVDFHITLKGQEDTQVGSGKTEARVLVQGAYANPMMKKQIEEKWDELHRIVKRIFRDQVGRFPPIALEAEGTASNDDGGES
jgi:hypothetical protein